MKRNDTISIKSIKKYKSISIVNFILLFLLLLFCTVSIVPFFDLSIVRGIQVVTIIAFFAYFLFHIKDSKLLTKIGIGLICFYILILSYWGIGYSTAGIGNYFFQISFFIPIIAIVFCLTQLSRKYNLIVYYFVVVMIGYRIINDIVIGQRYVGYSLRELQEMGSSADSTPFITAVLFMFCVGFLIFLNCKNQFLKLIHLGIIILTVYYIIFVGQRGSVVILLFVSFLLILYGKKVVSSGNGFYTFFYLLFLFLIMFLGDDIISFLIRLSPSERLTDRFSSLQYTYQHGITDDSFSGRLMLEMVSLRSWTSNVFSFFFGIGDHRLEGDFGMQGYVISGIGGHSEIIDSLARYGLCGFTILAYLYYNICKLILSLFKQAVVRSQVKAILIVGLLVGLTKGLFFPEIGLALFLLLPLSENFLNKQNNI